MKKKLGILAAIIAVIAIMGTALLYFALPRYKDKQLINKFVSTTESMFPAKTNRGVTWQKRECADNDLGYVKVATINQNGTQDLNWFCDDICDWIELCLEAIPYEEAPWLYSELLIDLPTEEESFDLTFYVHENYDRKELYNALYGYIDRKLTSSDYNLSDAGLQPLQYVYEHTQGEAFEPYADAECSYTTADGITYGMFMIDRAAGSSFYMLAATSDGGKSYYLVNQDPYCGMGGQAEWITFIDDTSLGFACLSYNGGDDGILVRTEDGGVSFTPINYPSAQIELSDGTVYNPFVIPEKVWRENDEIFLLARQSEYSGDYYNEELDKHPSGLYVSHDNGLSFEYVGER